MTFGKVMGGGFPAAAFGGRADVMAHLAPEGPVYQAGTLSGNPVATTAGLATLRLATDEVYAHIDGGGRHDQGRRRRGARPRPASRTWSRPRAPCSRCSSPTAPVARLRRRLAQDTDGVRRVLPRHARPRASTCRRPPTRRGSSPPPTTTAPCRPCSTRSPRPRAAAAAAAERDPHDRAPTIVHLLRHGEVHNPDGVLYGRRAGLPPLRARPADGRAGRRRRSRTATSSTCVASPLERAQETAAPAGRAPRAWRSSPTSGSSSPTNVFEGKPSAVGDGALRSPSAWRHLWNPFRPSWGEPYARSPPG